MPCEKTKLCKASIFSESSLSVDAFFSSLYFLFYFEEVDANEIYQYKWILSEVISNGYKIYDRLEKYEH